MAPMEDDKDDPLDIVQPKQILNGDEKHPKFLYYDLYYFFFSTIIKKLYFLF